MRPRDLLKRTPMLRYFQAQTRTMFFHSKTLRDVSIKPLSSINTARAIIRYTLRWEDGETTTVYGHTRSEKTYAFLQTIHSQIFAHHPTLKSPRPLRFDRALNIFFYEEYPGLRLRDLLEQRAVSLKDMKTHLARSARWLALLHTCPVKDRRRYRARFPYSHQQILRGLKSSLAEDDYRDVQAKLRSLFTKIIPAFRVNERLIHRDPHLANIILGSNGSTLALIDYSESGLGDPAIDVAAMMVHLRVALQPFYSTKARNSLIAHFYSQYARYASPLPKIFSQKLHAHTALMSAQFWSFTVATNPRPNTYLRWVIRELQSQFNTSIHTLV